MPSYDPNIQLNINKLKFHHGVLLGKIMNLNKDLNRLRNELHQKNEVIEKLEQSHLKYINTHKKMVVKLDTFENKFQEFVSEMKAEKIRKALDNQNNEELVETDKVNDEVEVENEDEDEVGDDEDEYTEEEITVEETVEETEEDEEEMEVTNN